MTKRIAAFAIGVLIDAAVTVVVTKAVDRLFFRKQQIGFGSLKR
jgi:large-conductance mechanosensitive channel